MDNQRWKTFSLAVPLLLLCAGAASGEGLDLGTPRLTTTLPPDMLGVTQQATTNGGVACGAGQEFCAAPLLGIAYRQREAVDVTKALTHHDINVRAGWRLSLFDRLEVSTAAKLPLASASQTQGVMAGDTRSGATTRFNAAEIPLITTSSVTWGSDVLLKLNNKFNLNLFYDYSKTPSGIQGQKSPDERFGTRLEYKFK